MALEEPRMDPAARLVSRRSILRTLGGTAGAVAGLALAGCGGSGSSSPSSSYNSLDVDIANFALNLEYLEAEFYHVATTGAVIDASLTGGVGTHGATTGGQKVAFSDPHLAAVAQEIASDELVHVVYLRKLLGSSAAAKPAINLNALGMGFGSETEFLTLARAFEDVGVTGYAGVESLITDKGLVGAVAGILGAESYHASSIRFQVIARGITVPALDAKDIPPGPNNYFPLDSNSQVIERSTDEVGAIIRGSSSTGGVFFPNGLNGTIK